MRCRWFILLITVTLACNAQAESKTKIHSITPAEIHSNPRVLRAYKTTNNIDEGFHDEERVASGSAVETVTNSLKSTSTQLDDWLAKGTSTDDVFKLLTLDKPSEGLLTNSKLTEWIHYMKLFNKANPKKQTSLIKTLTAHYGDEALVKMIDAAKQVPSTATFAKRLQTEQRQLWLTQGKSPDDVFALLKLNKAGDKIFTHPEVVTWANYVGDFNKANPDNPVSLFSTLATRFNDETLVPMLIAAKKNPSTEKIAVQVQAVQTKLWLKDEKRPEYVFNLLRLNREGRDIFKSPLFTAWVQYTDDFRKIYYGTDFTTIATLTKYYGDENLTRMILEALNSPSTANIAKRLEIEQLRNWYVQKFTPKDVFNALNLYSEGVKSFESPLYTVWTKYATYLSAAEPEHKVSILTNLLKVYSESNLVKVLRAGNKNPKTKEMTTKLEDELVDVWLEADRSWRDIYSLLRLDRIVDDNDPSRQLYHKFFKAYALS
ncbi:hypothetical protein L917_14285 [Phytophthora nicotianae]|uniref:RxLR effector PexRD54 WY domain-containing protein n=1 Tax=Phytophthora nicotianae TaxID=4792 RepID=W2KM17_PHYNI|nr:hypothetical protein L917_14285 [Phytophthora nicotianae]